jgi:hypothetical protein
MPTILHCLPFFDRPTTVTVGREIIRVRSDQIIAWISLSAANAVSWDRRWPRMPVILDTGYNHNFSIQVRHLVQWAGMDPRSLTLLRHLRDQEKRVPLHAGALWIYPNRPGKRVELAEREPVRLALEDGLAIYPDDGSNYPRLPLLGLKALADNHLYLTISGWRRSVKLRTRRRWWPFD